MGKASRKRNQASVVVFTRSIASRKGLHDVTEGEEMAPFASRAQAWLTDLPMQFLLIGHTDTGGPTMNVFMLAARDEQHLLGEVLLQAAKLIRPEFFASSCCAAFDPDLHAVVNRVWEEFKAPRATKADHH